MGTSLDRTLRQALSKLEAERVQVDRQIGALRQVLGATSGNGAAPAGGPERARRPMSAAARKAVSARMKAYWAKRRQESGKNARAVARRSR